ncbi:MAG TPA: FAD-dependent oxidoreductase, partial [Polyangiaceae bacterium]|nr:FAD-dependent oxidoreductase [Polyangiaceae bacterium]
MSGASEAGRREPYDVCVIGAGPGGFAAAMRAHDLGKRVLLVEKGRVGGAGLHAGALSSKTMWHLSNDYAGACRTDRGYRARDVEVSYRAVMGSVRAAVREREELLTRQLAGLATPDARGGEIACGERKRAAPRRRSTTPPRASGVASP